MCVYGYVNIRRFELARVSFEITECVGRYLS